MGLKADFPGILEAARAGGEWAWAALYRDLAPSVRGYLRARGASDPDDVLGEVFLHLVRDLRSFEGTERDFRAWVFTVAHHRLLDSKRYERRRPSVPAPDEVLAEARPPDDPETDALDHLELERARRLIGRLSADQKNVLLLRLFGQLTVDEVAAALGKRPGAVKALQRRGLSALEREISRGGVTLRAVPTLTRVR
jgi:RNA polymerase sigma-70 factor (ECF subfamily)